VQENYNDEATRLLEKSDDMLCFGTARKCDREINGHWAEWS